MAIVITKQPIGARVGLDEFATFTVEATGDNLTYKWKYNTGTSNDMDVKESTSASGATTPTLQVKALSYRHGYSYHCIITDASGDSVTSVTATLTIGEPVSAKGLVSHSTLTAIADAIRAKTETTAKMLPANMAALIAAIEAGGYKIMNGDVMTESSYPSPSSASLGTKLPASDNYMFFCVVGSSTSGVSMPGLVGAVEINLDGSKSGVVVYSHNSNYDIKTGSKTCLSAGSSSTTLTAPSIASGSTAYYLFPSMTYKWWYVYE